MRKGLGIWGVFKGGGSGFPRKEGMTVGRTVFIGDGAAEQGLLIVSTGEIQELQSILGPPAVMPQSSGYVAMAG